MESAQRTTTRVAPIDFTAGNAVAKLRISKVRGSDEDLSQVHDVIDECSMQNRSTEQTLFRNRTQSTAMAGLLMQFSTFALTMEKHFLIQQSQFLNILNLDL